MSLVAAAVAGCGETHTATRTITVSNKVTSSPSATGDQRIYGRIRSMKPAGDSYELRIDPAWHLSGVAANVAQAEDQGSPCAPRACPPVANDNYVVDEGHRLLTFVAPATVRGNVLAKAPNGYRTTEITAKMLAQLVAGERPLKLFEPLSTGVWILAHVDTVRAFEQQYVP